ncbi:recombinase family protein [Alloscardovia theropitheci]|uniref:Recombinase family protein n=1 Tax=Alloscardovia theropitheci TaxID=2496842 RepID=A0A4R0QX18_9BIFI|nr:recombinase family protein [Alloscardovia theropitheci]TCD53911.1 recombinase family protein [Alloscardovia theropitheci]
MLVGYARVSTSDQNINRQIDLLAAAGVDTRNIYQEKITGTTRKRPELTRMLEELQPHDTVIIVELSRISRSTQDMLSIIEQIKTKGAFIKSLHDTWLDTTDENPMSAFLLTVMAALSQLERDQLSQRVKEGLESAKNHGKKLGCPSTANPQASAVTAMYTGGMKISEISKQTRLSRSTIYRILRSAHTTRVKD